MISAAVAALVAALMLWAAAPATAQEDAVHLRATAVFNQSAPPQPQASPRPATFADTSASVRELAVFGVLLLLAGSTLLLFRRQDVH